MSREELERIQRIPPGERLLARRLALLEEAVGGLRRHEGRPAGEVRAQPWASPGAWEGQMAVARELAFEHAEGRLPGWAAARLLRVLRDLVEWGPEIGRLGLRGPGLPPP